MKRFWTIAAVLCASVTGAAIINTSWMLGRNKGRDQSRKEIAALMQQLTSARHEADSYQRQLVALAFTLEVLRENEPDAKTDRLVIHPDPSQEKAVVAGWWRGKEQPHLFRVLPGGTVISLGVTRVQDSPQPAMSKPEEKFDWGGREPWRSHFALGGR